jgi:hypothetical protein
MKFNPKESIRVHIHHAPNEDGGTGSKHDCLSSDLLKPGDAIGGELAGGFFYIGLSHSGEVIASFVNTCYPENIESGEIAESEPS